MLILRAIHRTADLYYRIISFREKDPELSYFFLHRANALTKIGNMLGGPEWKEKVLVEERLNPRGDNRGNPQENCGHKPTNNVDDPVIAEKWI